jgi:hypothetical protein
LFHSFPFSTTFAYLRLDVEIEKAQATYEPGALWRPLLTESNFLVLNVYFQYWGYYRNKDPAMTALLTESLSILCALRGEVFESSEHQALYLFTIMGTVMKNIVR